jgi:hypothetical protein
VPLWAPSLENVGPLSIFKSSLFLVMSIAGRVPQQSEFDASNREMARMKRRKKSPFKNSRIPNVLIARGRFPAC